MAQNDISDNLTHWDYIGAYSTWMYHSYARWIGKRVLDIGAGMGRMVGYYVERCERAVATDIFPDQVAFMRERFSVYPQFEAVLMDIARDDNLSIRGGQFDTVLCVNVLEHIEDDAGAVARMKRFLCAGGHLILFVPALSALYCQLDRNVSHCRRYDRGMLRALAVRCGMEVVENRYFNFFGIFPYWLKGRRKNLRQGESFSTGLNESNSRLYNFASKILEPLENLIPPPVGISELIVLRRPEGAPGGG